MVAAYSCAGTVKLTRCLWACESREKVSDMLAAVAAGGRDRRSGQPICGLELKHCGALQDEHVAQICSLFPGLRCGADTCIELAIDSSCTCLCKHWEGPWS